MATLLRDSLTELGVPFFGSSQTNQIFPVLPTAVVKELEKDFFFYEWAPEKNGMIPIRLVTAWGTTKDDVESFLHYHQKITFIETANTSSISRTHRFSRAST